VGSVFLTDFAVDEGLAGGLAIAEPEDHGLTIEMLGPAMGDVCEIDAGGGEGGSPGSVMLQCGVVELAVATSVHLGP